VNNVQLITRRPELALKQTPGFLAFIDQYKALEAQYKAATEAWGAIKTFMLDENIERIDLAGERGAIVLENDRRIWTYTDEVDDEYLLKTLDTKKLNKRADAGVDTPGTAWTRGKKLAKRLK
jgi:hypothetical protein